MHQTVRNTLEGLNLGKAQVYRDLCVFPILSTGGDGPDYLTMAEAIEARVITVTEMITIRTEEGPDRDGWRRWN